MIKLKKSIISLVVGGRGVKFNYRKGLVLYSYPKIVGDVKTRVAE